MRDADRINFVLDKIRQLWLQNPDLRLGQLLIIAVEPKKPCPELFYLEEKDLLRKLEEQLQFASSGPSKKNS